MKFLTITLLSIVLGAAEIEIMQDEFYVEDEVAYDNLTNLPFTGVIIYMFEKAGIQSKRRYYSGRLTGISESWYLNRQLEEQVSFYANKLHGGFRRWHKNGAIYAEGQYINGNKLGLWKVYDDRGVLLRQLTYTPIQPGQRFVMRPPRPPS